MQESGDRTDVQKEENESRTEFYSNADDSFSNEMPGMPRMMTPEEERRAKRLESWANLLVLSLVAVCIMPILLWGSRLFRTESDKHFLTGVPLSDFQTFQPILGGAPAPGSTEFMNRSIFVILWGPWDDASCEMLQSIFPKIQKAEKNSRFMLIPVVYFAKTNEPVRWYEMDPEERQRFLLQKQLERDRMDRFVQESFLRYGFQFKQVWWDPSDSFRISQIDMVRQDPANRNKNIDGLGFPTIIYAENGIIRNVWTSGTPKDLDEIAETLMIIGTQTQKKD